jgi:sugar/nucleoside kinase (ribokinase family)
MACKSKRDIVVVGGVNIDYLVRGQKLPKPGETAMGDQFQEAPCGKGANLAEAVSRLGARAALVARVGADRQAKTILKRLKDEGLDIDCWLRKGSRVKHSLRLLISRDPLALDKLSGLGYK